MVAQADGRGLVTAFMPALAALRLTRLVTVGPALAGRPLSALFAPLLRTRLALRTRLTLRATFALGRRSRSGRTASGRTAAGRAS